MRDRLSNFNEREKMNTTLEGLTIGAGITATIRDDWNDLCPKWADGGNASHYRVTLRYQKRTMSLWYYQGRGIKRNPKASDILETLISDYNCNFDSLDDFIHEMGLEIKSVEDFRNNEKLFKQLKKQNKRFERLIGNDDLFQRLQEVA